MVAKNKAATAKGQVKKQVKKLKLKKETLRDLEVKKGARMIKGGLGGKSFRGNHTEMIYC